MTQQTFGAFGDQLWFESLAFFYHGKRYAYADVRGVEFKQKSFTVSQADGKKTYESQLRVLLANGKTLNLRPKGGLGKFVRTDDKTVYDSMASAADWVGAYSFNARMDVYDAELKAHKYVTWGNYQMKANGDLFYRHAYCLNMRDDNVLCMLYPFHMACLRKPKKWWKRVLTFWMKRSERIDLRRDRDCFLYFMRRHMNMQWPSEALRTYRGIAADGTDTRAKPKPAEAPKVDAGAGGTQAPPPPPPPPKTMPTSVQHLATLGLTPDAKWDVVKASYRGLVKKHHPDLLRGRGASAETMRQAEEALKGYNAAYAWLEDFYKLKK